MIDPVAAAEPPEHLHRQIIRKFSLAATAMVAAMAAGACQTTTATGPAGASPPAASPSPSKAPKLEVTIVAPDSLGTRPKNVETQWTKAAETSAARYNSMLGVTVFISAYYGSESAGNLVLINAVDMPIPEGALDIVLNKTGKQPEASTIKPLEPVDPGPLGGQAKCGEFSVKGAQTTVCGWSDQGSMGFVTWYGVGLRQAASEFVATRAAIEKVV
jgi:hypothetical protein